MARLLSSADFGRYTVAVALSSLLTLMVELGMGGYLVREATQRPERTGTVLGHILMIQAGLGVVAVALCALFTQILGYDASTSLAVVLLASGSVFTIVSASCVAVMVALEHPLEVAAFQSGQAAALTLATIPALLAGFGPAGVAAAVLAVSALAFPVALFLLRRRWSGSIRLQTAGISGTFRIGAAYSAARVGAVLLTYLDAVIVQAYKGNQATALYGASYRLLLALMIIPLVYADAATRSLAHLARDDRASLRRLYRRVTRHMFMLGLPIATGGALLAGPLVELLFGSDYREAASTAALLLLGLVFAYPNSLATTTALAIGRERDVALIYGTGLLLNVALNLWLVPAVGIEGAGIAMLAAQAWLLSGMVLVCGRSGLRPLRVAALAKLVLAAGAMGLVVLALRDLPLPVPVLAGMLAYGAGLVALRALEPEDVGALTARFRSRGDAVGG
jgi:O-antigen/teichoic acid export membrane protein